MKGKRVIAGILLVGILATALAGCKNADVTKKEREKPVITLGSDSYPPYNYLNEDGIPTGIDVELATEAFRRMGYQVDVVQINWEKKKELVESGEIDCIMGCFSMEGRLDDYRWAGPYIASRQVVAVNESSDIYKLSDLEGKNLAVQSTTKPEGIFLNRTDERIPKLGNLISLGHRELIYTFLGKGYVDAVAAHEESIVQYMKDYDASFRILEDPLMVVGIGVAFAKEDDRGICEQMDQTLEEMRQDGTSLKIIKNYLETGEPVGSRTISKYTDLNLSSATIRNEMADLEEMGLIIQPHTSAGRIPSDKGYRLYVDHLMKTREKENNELQEVVVKRVDRLELLLKQMVKVLAANTNYATMITGPQVGTNKLKFLQLSRMEEGKLLAVIVVEGNLVKNTILNIESDISEEELLKLNVLINSALNGLTIDQINLGIITQLKEQAGDYSCVVGSVLEAVAEAIKHESAPVIYTSGANNIFRYPELSDEKNAQRLISTFEEKEELAKLLEDNLDKNSESGSQSNSGIQVYIGEENGMQDMKDCSVVTARYDLGDGVQGTLGVVGPKRMDYEKVVGTLKNLRDQLDAIYKKNEP